jgi:hypothetical protein
MSRGVIPTHAGDDSDGKIWGIEGMNILFLLASGMIGLGLALMLSHRHSPGVCVGIGSLPFVVTALYIFGLRQGKPKSFDTDLLETLLSGNGWMAPVKQPRNPLLHAGSHASS